MKRSFLAWAVAAAIALASAGLLIRERRTRTLVDPEAVASPVAGMEAAPPVSGGPSAPVSGGTSSEAARPASPGSAQAARAAILPKEEPRRSSHLAGRVVDGKGTPLAGVRVGAASVDPGGGETQALTGESGTFRLEALGEGPFVLVAKAEGRRTAVLRDVRAGAEGLEIVLPGKTGIAGVVLDSETGKPVRRFAVVTTEDPLRWQEKPDSERSNRTFEADDGSFEISDLEAGRFRFRFAAEGYVPAKLGPASLQDSEVLRDQKVRLVPSLTVRGRVVAADSGAPVEGAALSCSRAYDLRLTGRPRTSADGAFEVKGVPPGDSLEVDHRDFVEATTGPLGMAGERIVDGLVVRLARGSGLDGYALAEDGSPYEGAQVGAFQEFRLHPQAARIWKHGETDRSGYFLIRGLVPDRYSVSVQPRRIRGEDERSRKRRVLRGTAEVEEGKVARVRFEPRAEEGCTVRGRVLRGSEPIAAARVTLFPASGFDPATGFFRERPEEDQSGADGTFEIRGVPPGEATLEVMKGGVGNAALGLWRIEVPASGEFVFDARLTGGEIRGRVFRASDRRALAGASVRVVRRPASPGHLPFVDVETDEEGRYRVRDLPPGSYVARVEPTLSYLGRNDALLSTLSPSAPRLVEVAAEESVAIDFALEGGGTAVVRVTDPRGAPMPGEMVSLLPLEEEGAPDLGKEVWSDARGLARADGLARGRYVAVLGARPEYVWQASEPFLVREGEESALALEIKEPIEVRVRVLGAGDAPVEGARVRFSRPGMSLVRLPMLDADQNGVLVAHLPAGAYTAEAQGMGYPRKSRSVRVEDSPGQEVVLRLGEDSPR